MVKRVTNLIISNGLRAWIIQRITAVILAAYVLCIIGFMYANVGHTFDDWAAYITSTPMRFFGLISLLSILLHARIGLWTVYTDYIKNIKLRMVLQFSTSIYLLVLLFWGAELIWG